MKKLIVLFSVILVIITCSACGKKGNPRPPKEYGDTAVQSGISDDFCE